MLIDPVGKLNLKHIQMILLAACSQLPVPVLSESQFLQMGINLLGIFRQGFIQKMHHERDQARIFFCTDHPLQELFPFAVLAYRP